MAGKNQPYDRARVIMITSPTKARKIRKARERLREQQTRRVTVPRR